MGPCDNLQSSEVTVCETGTKRQLVDKSSHQKKPLFHFWFKFLLLFCLGVFICCYSLSGSSTSYWGSVPFQKHYQKFFYRMHQTRQRPSYMFLQKHSEKLNEFQETPPNKIQETPPKEIHETPPNKIQETPPKEIHETPPHKIQETTPSTCVLPSVAPTDAQYHAAYPSNYHFIMDKAEVCKTKNPFLVLMVPVAPNDVAARAAIRQTWANDSLVQGKVVLTLFMLGLSSGADVEQQQETLKQENQQHRDLIQSDFIDTYINLTTKTMVIMDWLATRCPTAAYGMKIDSDMFLNIDNLVIMLQQPGIPKTNYLTGLLMWNRPVIRLKNSKWYVPEELYPDPRYPTYTLGMGYVFSNDLPGKFVDVSKSIKPFNIEDAYIGMCMKKLGLTITPPPDPSQFKAYNTGYDRCTYSKVITFILGSPKELVKYWTDLKKPGAPC